VRRTLSEVGGRLVFSKPKTESSAAAVALMGRAVAALEVQALRQQLERDELGADYADQRLVFAREDGAPTRPETVSKRFPVLCKAARRQWRLSDLGEPPGYRWCARRDSNP
jgi:hypothetical protein